MPQDSLSALALSDNDRLLVWVTSPHDSAPIAGARVRFPHYDMKAQTDADGIALIDLPDRISEPAKTLLIETDSDSLVLPKDPRWMGCGWRSRLEVDDLRWFVHTDKAAFCPGDHVHVKGWIRVQQMGKAGQIQRLDKERVLIYDLYSISTPREAILSGRAKVSPETGFGFTISLPEDMPTGKTIISLKCGMDRYREGGHATEILVAEHRESKLDSAVPMAMATPAVGSTQPSEVNIYADKDKYKVGQTAQITVQSPFDNAQGLLVFVHGGIQHFERFTIHTPANQAPLDREASAEPSNHGTYATQLQVDALCVPELEIHAFLSSDQGKTASAKLSIKTSTAHKRLTVDITPGAASTDITVRDATGDPVQADLAVMVVDAAAPMAECNPIANIIQNRFWSLDSVDSRTPIPEESLETFPADFDPNPGDQSDLEDLIDALDLDALGIDANEEAPKTESGAPVYLPKRHSKTLFLPTLSTDDNGRASFELALPGEAEYQILVLAASGTDQFGVGTASALAQVGCCNLMSR